MWTSMARRAEKISMAMAGFIKGSTSVNTGYAVGDGGLILKTADAGSSWVALNSGTTIQLSAVSFPAPPGRPRHITSGEDTPGRFAHVYDST